MDYKNDFKECGMMFWETDETKRNQNNEIKFNLRNNLELSVGDRIKHNLGSGNFSVYEITEIKEIRQSSLKDFNYYTCLVKWYKE